MRMRSLFVGVLLLPLLGAAPAAESLPTIAQLNEQFAAGKYQDVMRQIARLLALKGDAAKAYDRYELFVLRGEVSLRNKANPMAIESFAAAQKATADPEKQAKARANEILIRRSKPAGYVPKNAPKLDLPSPGSAAPRPMPAGPLPILEEADRKVAMAALLSDELLAVEPKVKAANAATNLSPVIEVARSLGDLRAIELAATGTASQSRQIGADLGKQAHGMIDGALGSMSQRVEACWLSASRSKFVENNTGQRTKTYGLFGLTSVESNSLKEVIDTCEKIQPVANDLAAVTDQPELVADARESQRLLARAQQVLNYDYNNEGRYTKDPRKTTGGSGGYR